MNVIELNVVASPLGGLGGALRAAKGLPAAAGWGAGGVRLLVGVGLYFGVLGLGLLAVRMAGLDKARDLKSVDKAGGAIGVVVLLPMLVLPSSLPWLPTGWFA